ncbi:sporulation protein YqfC [Alkaliphilus peptidifermentans]|uniref:Sporulation protein YqfC n=1 Tax=Alkaliphilus peptidifermentans DSM 18978 TaxID=1120976 RepID=A0A1G5BVN7_9FIRM|nr:sporulation protein YqfC [Alkaliphilus peptidifermentans]SCX94010.1 sporulation protein YqfC [Alkaliphilus peptidifermentans DSM 18978]
MKKTEEIKKTIADILELPQDIVLDLPKITMVGNLQLYVENHKGIVEYSSNRVRIFTKCGVLRVIGKNLLLKNIVLEEIVIVGEIREVEFDD